MNAPGNEETLVSSKSPTEVRRMFHDIAPTYDFLNHLLSANIDRRWRRFTARQLIRPGVRMVLDVCSGTGDLALAFSRRAVETDQAVKIYSADFTARMTSRAKEKFLEAGEQITPLVADTLNLPCADDQFDLVSVAFGIRNVCDLQRGLLEMTRVCRPGGTVAILEFSHPKARLLKSAYHLYFFQILPRIGRALTGTRAYSYLPKSVSKFPDTGEFSQLLAGIAGSPVKAHRLSFGIATLYIATVRKS